MTEPVFNTREKRLLILVWVFISLVAFAALAIGGVATIENGKQNAAAAAANEVRDKQNADLLACFDSYASAQSATSQAVREASVTVSEATTDRDVALDRLFVYIATDPPEGTPQGRNIFGRLLDANAALVKAQRQLARVRAANPVPEPPSTFCEVQP